MKFNTNSNAYIIIYSVVMVVIVAVLLAFVSEGLKERQNTNVLEDNKKQIAKAFSGENEETKLPNESYEDVIGDQAYILYANGELVQDEAAVFAAMKNLKDSHKKEEYPLFEAKEGGVVIPLYGKGLWDAIWGFVALASDMNTIKGIVLAHKGETPGLGAEIATKKHQDKYVGKKIFGVGENNELVLEGITLVKGGVKPDSANSDHEVDAITGGTKTSDGVTKMIKESLAPYEKYLKAKMVVEAEPIKEEKTSEGSDQSPDSSDKDASTVATNPCDSLSNPIKSNKIN